MTVLAMTNNTSQSQSCIREIINHRNRRNTPKKRKKSLDRVIMITRKRRKSTIRKTHAILVRKRKSM